MAERETGVADGAADRKCPNCLHEITDPVAHRRWCEAADPLADVRQRHVRFGTFDSAGRQAWVCNFCGVSWPCDTERALAALDAERADFAEWRKGEDERMDAAADLLQRAERAEAAIARARALHHEIPNPAPFATFHGQAPEDIPETVCAHCFGKAWPCPTAAALETETP